MSAQTIDYNALAKQAGAVSSVPDYDALAKQSGAVSSVPQSDDSFWGKVKAALAPQKVPQVSTEQMNKEPMPGSTEGPGLLHGLADYDRASGGEIAGGLSDLKNGNVTKGLHRVLSGFMASTAPVAALVGPQMAATAPVATGLSIAGGDVGSKAGKAIAEGLGATPDQAQLASDVGGAGGGIIAPEIPKLGGRALLLGKTPEAAYQSALKPSTTINPSKVESMVQTGLKNEIPVSKSGIEKLGSLLDDLQDKVTAGIGAGQGKTINPADVANRLDSVTQRFTNQVNPDADLNAIQSSRDEFMRNNTTPPASGIGPANIKPIPATDAQAMKVGTYQQLGSKPYGELSSATIESQKALARGIKEELEAQFPELHDLNAAEGSLYDLRPVLEKAVQRQANHQIMGIGTPIAVGATKALTGSGKLAAVAGALKGIVDNPVVKSHLAIALDKAGVAPGAASARIEAYLGELGASSSNSDTQENQPSK